MRIVVTLDNNEIHFFRCIFYVAFELFEQMRVDNNDNEFTHSFQLQTQQLMV